MKYRSLNSMHNYTPVRYQKIDDLDAKIERIISRTVKYYYTDWKNYDRPKYMRFKGSNDQKDKDFLLIVRECGTYIVRTADIYKENWATSVFEYYFEQENATYYRIELDKLQITKLNPEDFAAKLKKVC